MLHMSVTAGISLRTIDDFASRYINQYDDVRICAMRAFQSIINESKLSVLTSRLARDIDDATAAGAVSVDAHQVTRSSIQILLRVQCTSPAAKNFTRNAKDNDNDDDNDAKADKVHLHTYILYHSFAILSDDHMVIMVGYHRNLVNNHDY